MVNYCDNCGQKLKPDDIFCSNCGAQIELSKTSGTQKGYTTSSHTPHQLSTQPKLYRSRDDRWIAGICGGLGRHFNIDPILIRIGFIIAVFGYGTGLILYIILALFIEEEP
jgi:phage shock protein PspC (stress-responsive transcriptional regulator)